MEELETLKKQAYDAAKEILEIGKCKAGDLFVVGCSTSEVLGDKIGTASSPETAQACLLYTSGPSGIRPYDPGRRVPPGPGQGHQSADPVQLL